MIERLSTTQTEKPARKKSKAKQPEPEVSTIGKVFSLAELMAMKRDQLEKVAKEKGIIKGHLAKNKEDIVAMIAEVDDVVLDTGLTQKQELFCQLYASDVEFFGNGTQSYMEAYKTSNYVSAQAAASRLLSNVMVLNRIDEILQEQVLNDQMVDKQIGFWIRQKSNPMASVAAIKEYNKMKERTKDGGTVNNLVLIQQNNQIHFGDPRAKEVIDWFDTMLLEQTKAPQEGEAHATAADTQTASQPTSA